MMKTVSFDAAIEQLLAGKIGVLPTDTVYGLVARAEDAHAVTRIYTLKKRENKPGTLIAANINQLLSLGVPPTQIDAVKEWWPNPLSAVLTVNGNGYLTQGVGTLAMRVVSDDKTRSLLEKTGPLITSSANQPGEPHATTVDEAIAYFGGSVDFYVDGGLVANVQPSTIIRPTDDGIEVLRQGGIKL
jgi:L-threonylcarbamoyladenylate synthase